MCNPQAYQPTGPYFFKGGKNKGKAMEILLFKNYSLLKWWFWKIKPGDTLNEMQKHLKWIFEQVKKLKPIIQCSYCDSTAEFVGVNIYYDGIIIVEGQCCKKCQSKLWTTLSENMNSYHILKINFEIAENLHLPLSKSEKRKIIQFLKKAYGIKIITAQTVFNLLKNAGA